MNERARIAALKAGSTPSINDWLEASVRPKLRKTLEEISKDRRVDTGFRCCRYHRQGGDPSADCR